MACTEGPRSANWGRVKQRFRSLFEGATGPFKPVSMDALTSVVKESVEDVEAVRGLSGDADALNECGVGKLFIQVLSLVAVEEPAAVAQYFQEHPAIASPMLTLLLDVPWLSLAQSGWPIFGVLAQLNYAKQKLLAPMLNLPAVDGLANEAFQAYFDLMTDTAHNGDMLAMAAASQMYLRNPPQG